jgi:hypothetical protein
MKLSRYAFLQYLEPGEVLISVFRKHPLIMGKELMLLILFGYLLPIFLYVLFPEFTLFFVLWLSISLVKVFYILSIWYHDAILITSVSLVDVTWSGFFKRASSRLEYPMIEGVSYEINGFTRTIFNYGNVSVKSNGGGTPIVLKDAMNPPRIEREIMSHQEKFVGEQNLQDADALKGLLATLIKTHVKDLKNAQQNSNQS